MLCAEVRLYTSLPSEGKQKQDLIIISNVNHLALLLFENELKDRENSAKQLTPDSTCALGIFNLKST